MNGESFPDHRARTVYFKMGAEMLDVFPSQKHQHEIMPPATYSDLETPKAKSAEEARTMAEEKDNDAED